MVLSTLHTNDAPTTLTRMRNMGIAPFNIASSVILITAQRLAQRLCTVCRAPAEVPRQAFSDAGFKSRLDGSWKPTTRSDARPAMAATRAASASGADHRGDQMIILRARHRARHRQTVGGRGRAIAASVGPEESHAGTDVT
jgi:type II secretory ATPase GspE/PulE/Tfp pilus assembly ATPase PilB-like protein